MEWVRMKTWSSILRRSDSDEDYGWGDAYSGGPLMDEWEDKYGLDFETPRGVELHEHGRLTDPEEGLGFRYDGDYRYPSYSKTIFRSTPIGGQLQEGHHIERNPNAHPIEDSPYPPGGSNSIGYPWAYTYYFPGAMDGEQLHKGFNTLNEALGVHNILVNWGHEHPRGQKALEGFGRWE